MHERILITGSSGLIGSALADSFARNIEVVPFDLRATGAGHGDVRHVDRVQHAIRGCSGVVHLAAVSRVIDGERDPTRCWSTNVEGLRNVLAAAASSPHHPWVVFASSREVYGQPERLPATEDTPLRPVNTYGRTKVEGEQLIAAARRNGVRACVVRLSNVFGSTTDHAGRVVPAFVRGALSGAPLRIDGATHTFDFTYIDDVTRGLVALADLLSTGEATPPPIHFVSGTPTSLGGLASTVLTLAGSSSILAHAPPRAFDVARFVGDPTRARMILGWTPRVDLVEGLTRLIHAFRAEGFADPSTGSRG